MKGEEKILGGGERICHHEGQARTHKSRRKAEVVNPGWCKVAGFISSLVAPLCYHDVGANQVLVSSSKGHIQYLDNKAISKKEMENAITTHSWHARTTGNCFAEVYPQSSVWGVTRKIISYVLCHFGDYPTGGFGRSLPRETIT